MAIANAHHGKLLLTADLLQADRLSGSFALRLDHVVGAQLPIRFPPIDDLVSTLDQIASRAIAA
jgi:hypothetical protein